MQETQLNTIISFSPYIGFVLISLILYLSKKMTFSTTISLLGLTIAVKSIIYGINGEIEQLWLGIVQFGIATVLFVLLVMFMSNVSWETLLVMSSMLAFTPIPEGIPAFLGTYLLLLIYCLFKLDFKEVYRLLYDAVVSSGVGQALPNYEHLPDKEFKKGQKRITLLPFILIAYSLNALYYILSPYWMES